MALYASMSGCLTYSYIDQKGFVVSDEAGGPTYTLLPSMGWCSCHLESLAVESAVLTHARGSRHFDAYQGAYKEHSRAKRCLGCQTPWCICAEAHPSEDHNPPHRQPPVAALKQSMRSAY